MKGTLRRLLMSDAFMLIIGSTVHLFDALKSYDEAFFNYFGQVPLDRLDAEQVSELLRKRAEYDRNERFLRELPQQQAKVKTLVHLTGGNPRFVLMLYELLSFQQVTTIVQQLKRLVDELTPLLKDEMENLPPQQRKIIHALMERGGTAQPTDLTAPTRLPLNAITTQLKRLKDAQIVEVLGGGKGRAANYTVPDKLFSLWYQMRYLGQNRRRIELFVEMLRIWFEADERIETLRKMARAKSDTAPQALRDCAVTAEYLAASLKDSSHAMAATEICLNHWIAADLNEAVLAYADLSHESSASAQMNQQMAHVGFSNWLTEHGDCENAVKVLNEVISKPDCNPRERIMALINRGFAKGQLGDAQGEITDYTAAIELEGAPKDFVAWAFVIRGAAKGQLGDEQGVIADWTAAVELHGAPKESIVHALVNRGVAKGHLDDASGEIADYTAVIKMEGARAEQIARALVNRGIAKRQLDELQGAIADYTAAIELEDAPKEQVTRALVHRGVLRLEKDSTLPAFSDLLEAASSGITTNNLMSYAAAVAISAGQFDDIKSWIELVLQKFSAALQTLTNTKAREAALSFLNTLATPESEEVWPNVWRNLFAKLNPEVAETISFLEPVCRVLEGQDRTLLDALPPEQREFALEVLTKFEPKEKDMPPKPEPAKRKPANKNS